jgi:hypothetical protein
MDTPQLTPTSPAPPTPPELSVVTKAVQEQLDRERSYLKFAQEQAEKDRGYFKHLFDRSLQFLGILIVLAGALTWRSVDQLRDDVKASVAVALNKAQSDVSSAVDTMKADSKKELDAVREEVRSRVSNEFESEQITALVTSVARERSEKEFQGIIRSETSKQVAKGIRDEAPTIRRTVTDETKRAVQEMQPTIKDVVNAETKSQIDKSVEPIRQELKSYDGVIKTGMLATLARSDDRKSFDELFAIASGTSKATESEKRLAVYTVMAIIREKSSGIRMGYQFNSPQTPDSMKTILRTSPYPNDRLAALDNFPTSDKSLVPLLIMTIESDLSLDVVVGAFRKLNAITKEDFGFPQYERVRAWWTNHKNEY